MCAQADVPYYVFTYYSYFILYVLWDPGLHTRQILLLTDKEGMPKVAAPRQVAEPSRRSSKTFFVPEGFTQLSVQESIGAALQASNARFTDLLSAWDTDKDGTVSRKEFIAGLGEIGIEGTKADFGALFDLWDVDGGGSLDAKELQRALKSKVTVEDAKHELARRKEEKAKASGKGQLAAAERRILEAKVEREAELEAAAEALRDAAGRGDVSEVRRL